jgi:hypothetical protein
MRSRLKPRCHVHGVADHRVAVPDVTREHLARVDTHTQLERDPVLGRQRLIDLAHRGLHTQAGAHRALGVIAVRDRSAEDRHHVVADELVDIPTVGKDLLTDPPHAGV